MVLELDQPNRAGNNLHYHITSLICRQHCGSNHRRAATPVNWNNLISVKTIHNSLLPTLAYRADLHSALINCRPVVNKTQEIQLELVNNSLDLCILTKTCNKEWNTITPTRLYPNSYKSLSISRQDGVGSGIAIVYKSDLNISIASSQPFKTMESLCFSISTGNRLINLITIYRPPDSNVLEFCNELAKLLETNINLSGELILLGDFNIAVNKPLDAGPASFLDVLHGFNLINRVDKPTHRLCNTLYLIIHDADSSIIPKIKVDRLFSDHNIILFDISLPHTITTSKVKIYRKFNSINPDAFMKDIRELCLTKPTGPSFEGKVSHYHSMLQSILDIHAPIKSQKCSDHPRIPWFNHEIAKAIRLCRNFERVWYKDKSNRGAFALFQGQC